VAIMGVFSHRMLSRRNVQEKLTQSELERTNQHMREIQLQKRKEQLNALQNQINPHFLYNTLDTIRGLAIEKEALDIANIVATLSSMFKYSMDYADSLVPVGDEIEHLRSFLKIQAIRFPKKFTFEQSAAIGSCMKCRYRNWYCSRSWKMFLRTPSKKCFPAAASRYISWSRTQILKSW